MRFRGIPLVLGLLLSACASNHNVTPNIDTLQGIQQLNTHDVKSPLAGVTEVRLTALRETALQLGAQSGLAFRTQQINVDLEKQSRQLDQIFNFNQLLMDHSVLPPVLIQANESLRLHGNNTIRLADKVYRIKRQARFVTTPPTWHDYLWMNYQKPELPDASLLPNNKHEQLYWAEYTTSGWQQGIEQANAIFAAELARLKRDYEGMALYHKLLEEHIVSKPYVAEANLGITGNHRHLRINDQILRITALPELLTNSQVWQPVVAPSQQ